MKIFYNKTEAIKKNTIEIKSHSKIKNFKEVENITAKTISNDLTDEVLNGMIITGYETKFTGKENANGEIYSKKSLDNFIKNYFVDNELNMPLDIQHISDIFHTCGKVLQLVVNDTGYHVIGYIPKDYPYYNHVKFLIENKILQGFSKMGFCIDSWYDKEGAEHIEELAMLNVSLVTLPANMVKFDMKEVQNTLVFKNVTTDENEKNELQELFNPKN